MAESGRFLGGSREFGGAAATYEVPLRLACEGYASALSRRGSLERPIKAKERQRALTVRRLACYVNRGRAVRNV